MRIENVINRFAQILNGSNPLQVAPTMHESLVEHYRHLVQNYVSLVPGEQERLLRLAGLLALRLRQLSEDKDMKADQEAYFVELCHLLEKRFAALGKQVASAAESVEYKHLRQAYLTRRCRLGSRGMDSTEADEYRRLSALLGLDGSVQRFELPGVARITPTVVVPRNEKSAV